jgi:pantetheine-phosphate adenylyltransferase
MPRIALYPGSFDPVTNGHLDVVRHAVTLCDRLIVSIGVHSGKKPLFSTEERLEMVRSVFEPIAQEGRLRLRLQHYDNLTGDGRRRRPGATIMIRGLRDGTDLDYEMQLAGMNEPWRPTCTPCSCRRPRRPPDHRHTGATDRRHGRRRLRLRAACGRQSPEEQVRLTRHQRLIRPSASGDFMIRVLALICRADLRCPALAQSLPANLDKANAIVIDSTKGRIVIALRADLAPSTPSASSSSRATASTTTCRSTA